MGAEKREELGKKIKEVSAGAAKAKAKVQTARKAAKEAKKMAKDPEAARRAQKRLVKNKKKEAKILDEFHKKFDEITEDTRHTIEHYDAEVEADHARLTRQQEVVAATKKQAASIGRQSSEAMDATNLVTLKMAQRQVDKVAKRYKAVKDKEDVLAKEYRQTVYTMGKMKRKAERAKENSIEKATRVKDRKLGKLRMEDAKA